MKKFNFHININIHQFKQKQYESTIGKPSYITFDSKNNTGNHSNQNYFPGNNISQISVKFIFLALKYFHKVICVEKMFHVKHIVQKKFPQAKINKSLIILLKKDTILLQVLILKINFIHNNKTNVFHYK